MNWIRLLGLFLVLTGVVGALDQCGNPRCCLCVGEDIICYGQEVTIFPVFPLSRKIVTRRLIISSTRIRTLSRIKLGEWYNLYKVLIVNNRFIQNCENSMKNIIRAGAERNITIIGSCPTRYPMTTSLPSPTILTTTSLREMSSAVATIPTRYPTQSKSMGASSTIASTPAVYPTLVVPSPTQSKRYESKTKWGIIISIGVILVLCIIIVILGVCYYRKRKRCGRISSPIYLETVENW